MPGRRRVPERRFTTFRRLAAAACAALAGLLVLAPAAPAHARGETVRLTVTGVRAGRPIAAATWESDARPVGERLVGTLGAVSADGAALGPWRLVPVPGRAGAFTTAEVLPPGRWTLTAESSAPGIGRAEGVVDVPGDDPATAPPVSPDPAPDPALDPDPAPRPSWTWTRALAAVGVTIGSVAAVAVAVLFLRRCA
ncbi:hypothetical protein [Kitasatospora sp. NPDC088346]|uniref:hypothetical protein n=1 Tax=Kitasatospora sp. NPDC088346 TaxID=3364073 RepID=UPI00380B2F3F